MPDVSVLSFIALPVLGAITLLLLGDTNRYRPRDPLPVLITGTVFAAALLLPERVSTPLEVVPWPSVHAFGSRPAILVDQFALVFVFTLALIGIAATTVGDTLGARTWAMAILLWGGSLWMIISANILTLLVSWLLCEAALVGSSLLTRNSRSLLYRLAAGGSGAVALLLLGMHVERHPPADLNAVLLGLPPRWIATFFVIGAIRMGLYPLHLASFAESDAPTAPLVLGRLSSAAAGLYLWFRALSIISGSSPKAEYLVVLGGLAALTSAFVSWGTRSKRGLFPWLVGFELGIIVLALGFAAPNPTIVPALEMMNLLIAGSVFGLSLYINDGLEGRLARGWTQGLTFLAMASLLGLPPTPGFVARWALYRQAVEAGNVAPVLPIAVASGLLVPALLAAVREANRWSARHLPPHAVVGLTIVGLPLAFLSAQPLFLSPVLDILTKLASYPIIAPLIRSANSRLSAKVIALILIPVLAGYSLDRVHDRWRAQNRLTWLWRLLSLEWLYDLLASTVLRAAIAVSILLTILELGSRTGVFVIVGLLLVLLMLRR